MTTIELTDQEAEQFKAFRKYQAELLHEQKQWKELQAFAKGMQYGTFTLTIKDGLPYRVDNPLQTIVFGIKL